MRSVFLDYSTVSVGDLDPQALQAAAPNLVLREATRQADVADAIAGCEIVLLNKLRMTREIIAGSNSLKLIALAATGTNNIDLEAARDHGVAVCNIRDYCTPSVTQHVLGVLLALTHRLADYSRDATDGPWASSPHFTILRHPIRELGGRTLGVVGWGVLGKAVARACDSALGGALAKAFRLEGFDILDAVQHAALQFQEDGSDALGPPAFQCGFANVPTVRQLALIEVFDTHVFLLSGDCENVRRFSGSVCADVTNQDVRADVRAAGFRRFTCPRKQKTARRRLACMSMGGVSATQTSN